MARWPATIAVGLFDGNGTSTIASYPGTNQIGAGWVGSLTDTGAGNLQISPHANQQAVMTASHIDSLTLEATSPFIGWITNVSASRVDVRSSNTLGTAADPGRYHLIIHDLNGN